MLKNKEREFKNTADKEGLDNDLTHFRIIRILFMVPVYGIANLLAVRFYTHAIYYYLLGNAYAAIGLASFYQLLNTYVATNIHEQKDYFRMVKPKPWGWPLSWFRRCTGGEHGLLRAPRSGLTFYNVRRLHAHG